MICLLHDILFGFILWLLLRWRMQSLSLWSNNLLQWCYNHLSELFLVMSLCPQQGNGDSPTIFFFLFPLSIILVT